MKLNYHLSALFVSLLLLAVLPARADNVFTGPGLWTDGTKWSGGRPTSSSTVGAVIHGLCAATNEAEIIYGPNKWTAVGDWANSGRTSGRLDVNNTWMSFPTELYIGGDSEYFQEGGTNVMTKGVKIGYGTGYASSRMYMKNVDYVRLGAASVFGQSAPAAGGFAEYIQEGGLFSSAAAWTLQNKARMYFKDAVLSMSGQNTIKGQAVLSATGCAITNLNSYCFKLGTGIMAFTNCNLRTTKMSIGNDNGSNAVLDFKDCVLYNQYQCFICGESATSSTCKWTMTDCVWTNTSNEIVLGKTSGACAEVRFRGKTLLNVGGKAPQVAYGANSRATVVFEDATAEDVTFPTFTFASTPATAFGRIVLRNITGAKNWNRPTPAAKSGGDIAMEFDNAHFSGGLQYIPNSGTDNKMFYVLNNGASFTNTYDGTVYFPGNNGQVFGFCATNSAIVFSCGKEIAGGAKTDCNVTISLYDSDGAFATNSTWSFSTAASTSCRLVVAGTNGTNVVDVKYLNIGGGTNEIFLCGNTLRVLQITRSGSNDAQKFHFDGGTLRSRDTASAWIPAGLTSLVEEGGAVFDARHNVTIPGVLRHGGEAAKDGGVTKKGSGTLTLSSATAHTFTGDIVVEEGTLVATALSDWTLAAGQKIGGAGTLKVSTGFTAGGVRYDAAWTGGFTVDGDVSFAPGSTVDVTGVTKETEPKRITVLTANSISGAENISSAGLPDGWKLRTTGTSVSIAYSTGLILIVR